MTTAIAWGEADVRDCMAEFDPAAEDWCAGGRPGVLGRRFDPPVRVFAYWSGGSSAVYVGPLDASGRRVFADPIEAIQHAIALTRGE